MYYLDNFPNAKTSYGWLESKWLAELKIILDLFSILNSP